LSSDWKYRGIIRRDFRATHDGPEVAPWRKKAKKHDRTKCEHVFSEWLLRSWGGWRNGVKQPTDYGFFTRNTNSEYRTRKCKNCNKSEWQSRTKIEEIWYDKNLKIMNRNTHTVLPSWGGKWLD